MEKEHKEDLIKIIITSVILFLVNFIPYISCSGGLRASLGYRITVGIIYVAAYLIVGWEVIKECFEGFKKGEIFSEEFLMVIATIGAFALAIYKQSDDYNEAVFVMLFFQIGELFEHLAVGNSRKSISKLMDIRPDYANLEVNGKIFKENPEHVHTGSVIVVRPGEKIPIDGIIIEGETSLNTIALTGESYPRECKVNDEVLSGSINLNGLIKIKTTKEFSESTVSKILALVEESGERKSKSENFITKFARIYTPFVCISAILLAIIPPVINIITNEPAMWNRWIYRALTFLVISCPCALVISIPLSFFAGIGACSKNKILVKGSSYLESLTKIKTIIFDKTGTLTKGIFEVTGIHHNKIEQDELIYYAAMCESSSNHPISRSIVEAYGKPIDSSKIKNIQEISGQGITAEVEGTKVACGNKKLMDSLGIECAECHKTGTIVHIAINGNYEGHIVISDTLKESTKDAIKQLKKCGIKKTIMLTGDSESVAREIAESCGIDEYYSSLLPQDKVTKLEELLKNKLKNDLTAFTGDGINDAPVLKRSDLGIAMGGIGSDAAVEASDIVLLDDDISRIPLAIRASKKCLKIVKGNIAFSILVKFACLALSAFGIAGMGIAIFADVGVMIIAVLNATRALRIK